MKSNEYMSEKSRIIYPKILELMAKMPEEKLYYILGYMRSEADKTIQKGGSHE